MLIAIQNVQHVLKKSWSSIHLKLIFSRKKCTLYVYDKTKKRSNQEIHKRKKEKANATECIQWKPRKKHTKIKKTDEKQKRKNGLDRERNKENDEKRKNRRKPWKEMTKTGRKNTEENQRRNKKYQKKNL